MTDTPNGTFTQQIAHSHKKNYYKYTSWEWHAHTKQMTRLHQVNAIYTPLMNGTYTWQMVLTEKGNSTDTLNKMP